jgi:hypothetical protein
MSKAIEATSVPSPLFGWRAMTLLGIACAVSLLLDSPAFADVRSYCPKTGDCFADKMGEFVLVPTNTTDPAYIYFYVTGKDDIFNIRQGPRQWEVKPVQVTAVARGSTAEGTKVQVQGCARSLGMSSCGGWSVFTLVAPRTADCRAYTDRAMTAVGKNLSLNCGNSGDRWAPDSSHHFSWCMGLAVTDLGHMHSETALRDQAIQACATKASTTTPAPPKSEPSYWSGKSLVGVGLNTERPGNDFKTLDPPTADAVHCQAACSSDSRCKAWTYVKPNVRGTGAAGRCYLKDPAPGTRADACCVSGLRGKGLGKPKTSTPAPSPGTPSMGAALDVDVYDAPGGNGKKLGVLRKGSVVSLLRPCEDSWCNVAGNAVPTGKGWVYSGPDYPSLVP